MPDAISNIFTRRPGSRFTVPHPPLGERWMLVAHAAVTAAFLVMRKRGFDLQNARENAITKELEGVLRNDLLNRQAVDGFDKQFFGPVTRGSEVENFNGEKTSKKPDLVFHLQRENALWDQRQDAIFAECKPVDNNHSLSENYCAVSTERGGVARFVLGDYAWAMHEAILIGYVRNGFCIEPDLVNSFADPKRHKSLGSPTKPAIIISEFGGEKSLYQTHHQRLFAWKETGQPATSIALFHSWHDCE